MTGKKLTTPDSLLALTGDDKSKKALKRAINSAGFFVNAVISEQKTNVVELKAKIAANEVNATDYPGIDLVPNDADAIYFRGIASNGELNRNGYIIEPSAWDEAIPEYLGTNPTILLQHDRERPIGRCVWAERTNTDGGQLEVAGFVFDSYTDGKFGKGLFGALSTGHFDKEVIFRHEDTGEELSEDEFRRLSYEEQYSDKWIPVVKKLDFVEFSVVTMGSNRKSTITKKNAIESFLSRNEAEEITPPDVTPVEKTEPDAATAVENDSAKSGATPEAETVVEAELTGEEKPEEGQPTTGEGGAKPAVAAETNAPRMKISDAEYSKLKELKATVELALNAVEPESVTPEATATTPETPVVPAETNAAASVVKPDTPEAQANDVELKRLAISVGLLTAQMNAYAVRNAELEKIIATTPARKALIIAPLSQLGQATSTETKKDDSAKGSLLGAILEGL